MGPSIASVAAPLVDVDVSSTVTSTTMAVALMGPSIASVAAPLVEVDVSSTVTSTTMAVALMGPSIASVAAPLVDVDVSSTVTSTTMAVAFSGSVAVTKVVNEADRLVAGLKATASIGDFMSKPFKTAFIPPMVRNLAKDYGEDEESLLDYGDVSDYDERIRHHRVRQNADGRRANREQNITSSGVQEVEDLPKYYTHEKRKLYDSDNKRQPSYKKRGYFGRQG
jgi:hypothetical protein